MENDNVKVEAKTKTDQVEAKSETYDSSINNYKFYEEFDSVFWDLEKFHSIFYQVTSMGYPTLTKELPTAAVAFNEKGKQIQFLFNPDFWKSLDEYNRAFVICHECLHVILNHGVRLKKLYPQIANQAADVVINHMLVDKFGFDREKILNWQNFCWIDTIFKDNHETIDKHRSFEYYYQKITEDPNAEQKQTMDMHDFLDKFTDEVMKELGEKVAGEMYPDDVKDALGKMEHEWKDAKDADKSKEGKMFDKPSGDKHGEPGEPPIPGECKKKLTNKKKIIHKWEQVIKKWTKRAMREIDKEQWVRRARRFTTVDKELLIPSEASEEAYAKDKIDVLFFMDASGSCWDYQDRFFAAAKSLNPLIFIPHLLARSTVVREMKEDISHGGGSDDFRCMEKYIQTEMAAGRLKSYPSLIFHITDGYDCSGVKMTCKYPKRWHWFLTPNGTPNWIPEGCHIHNLVDFE